MHQTDGPDASRIFSRRHLYSALRLSIALVERSTGAETSRSATGFIVRTRQNVDAGHPGYLVTNRHVLDPLYRDRKLAGHYVESVRVTGSSVKWRDADSADSLDFTVRSVNPVFPAEDHLDIAVLDLAEAVDRRDVMWVALSASDLVTRREILTDVVGAGSEIVMSGYPDLGGAVGDRPILVPGMVSSDLRHDAVYGGHAYKGRGLCHAFSRGGMSGSPLLTSVQEADRSGGDEVELLRLTKILGVNVGHVIERVAESTLSLFVPAPALIQLLRAAGADGIELIAGMDTRA